LLFSARASDYYIYIYIYIYIYYTTIAYGGDRVARSLKLRHVDLGPVSTWVGDHQGRLGAVNLGP